MNDMQGEKIIFLISQPRAGSTLTQKILGSHPDIYTTSEPWILLHPFSILKPELYQTTYDFDIAQVGFKSFIELLPNGLEAYQKQVASLYDTFYQQIASKNGKKFFLDKTPRYFFIIPELAQAFPLAKFIILVRNPLAVLCSIIDTWIDDRWLGLRTYKHDLVAAPSALLKGIELLGDRAIILQYERLLSCPDQAIQEVCQKLEVEFTPSLLNYGEHSTQEWALGDPTNVYRQKSPNKQNADRWINSLSHPQRWRLVRDYLKFLGEDTVQSLGYDYCSLKETIDHFYPGMFSLWNTLSLEQILKDPKDFFTLNLGYLPVRIINALQRRGINGITKKVVSSFLPRLFP